MFPDQNQPQPALGPQPPAQDPSAPYQPNVVPLNPVEAPAPVPVAAPTGLPAAPTPNLMPNPVASPGPVLDPSQIGYVPPAQINPVSPIASMNGAQGKQKGRLGKFLIVLAAGVALIVASGVGLVVKTALFTGSSVAVADLTDETQGGMTFKYPKQWSKVDVSSDVKDIYSHAYTEDGKAPNKASQGLLIGTKDLGFNFDTETTEQQQRDIDDFIKNYEDPSSVETDSCPKATGLKAVEVKQPNYTRMVSVEYTCERTVQKLHVKVFIGLKGELQQYITIAAIDKTWDKSGPAFDEILNTFKPST